MTNTAPAVYGAFLAVCADLDAIGKSRRVQEGPARFAFRGVDDVMNALHKPLADHGLICVPQVQERIPEARQTRNGGVMNVVHLRVRFSFFATDGSTFYAEGWGEGQDSGDKATGKAHSMAYKSALLQAFHIPTEDTPDADRDTTPAEPVQRGAIPAGQDPWAQHEVRQPPQTDQAWLKEWEATVAKAESLDAFQAAWKALGDGVQGHKVTPGDAELCKTVWREAVELWKSNEAARAERVSA